MAVHPDLKSLLHEPLPEYLAVAEYCVAFRKPTDWGQNQVGGCFGYPAALLLFSIADTIGSFHRGLGTPTIKVGPKTTTISKDGFQHFYILNSEYYGQSLDEPTIKGLYDNFRSLLAHNAAVAPAHFLVNWPHKAEPFPMVNSRPGVNVSSFLAVSRKAIRLFLAQLDQLLPTSQQARNIGLKQ